MGTPLMQPAPIRAFVLAAGRGNRLRPLTDELPKPLLPVLGRPALERVLTRLCEAGILEIALNTHYRMRRISRWIRQSPWASRVTIFEEEDLLGTGGALDRARGFLSEGPFLIHNADICSDIDLFALIERHRNRDHAVTLAVHDRPGLNNLRLDGQGRLVNVVERGESDDLSSDDPSSPDLRAAAFTGIALYEPEFLHHLPAGPSDLVPAWLRAAGSGVAIGTVDVSGARWTDIGTPPAYAEAVWRALDEEGERLFVHPRSETASVTFEGMAVIEGGGRAAACRLRNVIVLEGGAVENEKVENCIVGPGFRVSIPRPGPLVPSEDERARIRAVYRENEPASVDRIGTGGSDRSYYRIREDGESRILLLCRNNDPDFPRQIERTRLFSKTDVPVPRLFETPPGTAAAVFEDLGDLSLYNWMKFPREEPAVEAMYRRILDGLRNLHGVEFRACPPPATGPPPFDRKTFRWESDYFFREFVEGVCRLEVEHPEQLETEFDRLARETANLPQCLIHRDCQSQNILIAPDGRPGFIDFQGSRSGPPEYDLASLLWDPYVEMGADLRDRLLAYYRRKSSEERTFAPDTQPEGNALLLCRTQRLMQVLGAYAFLSRRKGKPYFARYIPGALERLVESVEERRGNFPALAKLVNRLRVSPPSV